jgi:hypothetical protein
VKRPRQRRRAESATLMLLLRRLQAQEERTQALLAEILRQKAEMDRREQEAPWENLLRIAEEMAVGTSLGEPS